MPTATALPERRRSVRNRTLIGGSITFSQCPATLDCVVRNLSEDGALLVLSDDILLPELFELHIPLKRESRMVRGRWRDGEHLGVTFATGTRQSEPPIPLDLVRRLRKLEQENAALKARVAELTERA